SFDNFMREIDVPGDSALTAKNRSEIKFDNIVMAPFCPHDCFHMHWRWSDNGNEEPGAWGFKAGQPCKLAGAPLVPENQDVFLVPLQAHQVSYLAMARGTIEDGFARQLPANEWQIFCHHGAGYGLRVGDKMDAARFAAALVLDEMSFRKTFATLKTGRK